MSTAVHWCCPMCGDIVEVTRTDHLPAYIAIGPLTFDTDELCERCQGEPDEGSTQLVVGASGD